MIYTLLFVLTVTTTTIFSHGTTIDNQHSCASHTIQPIKCNGCFFNHPDESRYKHMWDALQIFWATKTSFTPYFSSPPAQWMKHDPVISSSDELQLQWIGHASFLIQVNDVNILTDPVFYDLNAFLYPRKTKVGIDPKQLPHIDCVIISHNHRDHLDEPSMQLLKAHQPTMLVPEGTKDWFIKRGFLIVIEHTWWQTTTIKKNDNSIIFTFVPAVHWSGRHGFDAHTSLWGGWIIKATSNAVYFAGDTGFDEPMFKAIKEYAGKIDCALLPIGPCEPRSIMCHSHMGPEDAVNVTKILNPTLWIPMHWGTFGLGPDAFDTPIKRLELAWSEHLKQPESRNTLYKIKFGERLKMQ